MESVMKIRRQILVDGRSIRSVSRETGLSRNTLRKYLTDEAPPRYRRSKPRRSEKLAAYESLLTQWYTYDQQRPKRERRTAHKYYEQLLPEGYQGSYCTVCRFIKQLKAQQGSSKEAYIPLCFEAGNALQFDWSQEVVILGGVQCNIRVAQFRLAHSRKSFVCAYLRESQEMLLDAFNQALAFYQGVPKRVLIDNPKTMVVRIGPGKARDFHPRFMALMNHYVLEPVACTPAAGWEKGQIENQVSYVRNQFFKPQLRFDDLAALNTYLLARCHQLAEKKTHPERKTQTIAEVFAEELPSLRPLGRPFDGYIEKPARVTSTCLVRYDCNHYSVPSAYAKQRVSLRGYASRIVIVSGEHIVAEHPRCFDKHEYCFEPWHYVPLLQRKPGALRDGAPFQQWSLPPVLQTLKQHYLARRQGDRDFVQLLLWIQQYGSDVVLTACELALEAQTLHLSAIENLIHRLTEPQVQKQMPYPSYPPLQISPLADCQRYERLLRLSGHQEVTS